MKTLTGAEIVIECLKEQGVDTVFGYPGGAILNIYDALYKHKDEITHILTSHEQGASHAADGYARATGKVGVCMATSGPGATNLVTGIATANLDSIPMVAITCNVTTGLLGKDSFQEIDILGVTMPITKYNFIVKDVTKLADVIRRAFVIAKSGRPGPVLVDITKDVTAAACEYEPKEPQPIERETELIREEDMEKAIEMIKAARKPFIFVGGGAVASDAANELSAFAHKIQAPVGDSLMGKGAFDGTDVLYTGMIGMHGTKTSNLGVAECDLLSLELEELRSNVVGAKLGQEAISTSLKAGLIGFAIVIVFMIAVYLLPGLAASLALCLYVGLILILLVAFEVTLTLPGVAGIILSIGMAVDANVIIFTRIKEEIGLGTSVKNAIKAGFAKALSAIIDGNVTTLIAAAVLFWRGSGTVKGFAATLAIGIVLSMFTALFVTKFALNCFYEMGFEDAKFYGCRKDMKTRPFLKFRKLYFALSLVIILAGVGSMIHNQSSMGVPLNYSMEFRGGTSTNVTFNEDMSLEDISSQVVPVVEKITGEAGTQTQKVAGSNEVIIKTRTLNMDEREELNQALADQFGVDKEKITADSISGAVSQEMKRDAIVAVTIATICMLIYIWFRFSNITFAAGAVLALMHDVLVVLTCYAMLRWSVGSTFIACMLTIVGYSINATIVIFDRIRENMKLLGNKESAETIVNTSISQTLTRSINTTLTTFVMVLILYILGVSSIREFALPLMVGLICGTYSSVCLSGSVWYVLNKKRMEKNAKPAGKKAKAEK